MSPRRVPAITHLQFLVLAMLRAGPRLGRHVRARLARHGARRSAPAFYQMMASANGLAATNAVSNQQNLNQLNPTIVAQAISMIKAAS